MPIVLAENFAYDTVDTLVSRYPGSAFFVPTTYTNIPAGIPSSATHFPVPGSWITNLPPIGDSTRMELVVKFANASPAVAINNLTLYMFGLEFAWDTVKSTHTINGVDIFGISTNTTKLHLVMDKVGSEWDLMAYVYTDGRMYKSRGRISYTSRNSFGYYAYVASSGIYYGVTNLPNWITEVVVAYDTELGTMLKDVSYEKLPIAISAPTGWTPDNDLLLDVDKADPTVQEPKVAVVPNEAGEISLAEPTDKFVKWYVAGRASSDSTRVKSIAEGNHTRSTLLKQGALPVIEGAESIEIENGQTGSIYSLIDWSVFPTGANTVKAGDRLCQYGAPWSLDVGGGAATDIVNTLIQNDNIPNWGPIKSFTGSALKLNVSPSANFYDDITTIQMWVKPNTALSYFTFWFGSPNQSSVGARGHGLLKANGVASVIYNNAGTSTSVTVPIAGTWSLMTLVSHPSYLELYWNGARLGSLSQVTISGTAILMAQKYSTLTLCGNTANSYAPYASQWFIGPIRVLKGVALTTMPTAPWTLPT